MPIMQLFAVRKHTHIIQSGPHPNKNDFQRYLRMKQPGQNLAEHSESEQNSLVSHLAGRRPSRHWRRLLYASRCTTAATRSSASSR